ncbi:serine hydrolase [Mucilaginibacter sp. BT774]|uniref:serine hydrolase domain-containing protein n=1 Tax=Mucilaginibacter sp. BT774 TaxID=3062276 RepID=UPI00267761FC|nr:serine hydrolase domain-containing protein [Mucilaginibacter sp. BT774]MDO3626511.1 serine hydrolase domain-containing protein [Mucilaginibacter sp. BT774]
MKAFFKQLFIVAFCLFSVAANAQSIQQRKNDSVFTLVYKYFNERQAESIYSLAGELFKKQLSAETFKRIADQQLFPLGPIRQSSLISFQNNKLSTYKLEFDSGVLQLLMTLDKDDKLELFLFKPYKEAVADKLNPVPTSNLMRTLTDKKVDSAARSYIQKANTVGLSIGIIKNGVIHTYNYGETATGNGKLPDANSIYEIGSITKTFTATLLAYYANEGKVKLAAPIIKYLPDSVASNKALQGITLEMLSNHTSGLPRLPDNFEFHSSDPYDPYKDYNRQHLYEYLKSCKLNSKPGETYAYSNLAVGLLGTILEQVSGETFEEMVKEVICTPLVMQSTAQHLSYNQKQHFVTVYNEDGKATSPWSFNTLAPCGALRSTVNDLLLYVKANMTKSDTRLSKAFDLAHQVTFNKDAKLGLAWHIIVANGVEYYFHDGGTYGCNSFMAFNIEKGLAVVVLSNSAINTSDLGINLIKKFQ